MGDRPVSADDVQRLIDDAVPPGVIMAFGGETNRIPHGWELCDGREVSADDEKYKRLAKAIGTVWGGSGTPKFYLPDLRGMFLRGVSGDSTRDPERESRKAPRHGVTTTNPGNQGNQVGSLQDDAFRRHEHRVGPIPVGHTNGGNNHPHRIVSDDGPSWNNVEFWQTAQAHGGEETRPINAYVHYIIKL